jgi:hypothetical protein
MGPRIRAAFVVDRWHRPLFSDDGRFTHYRIRLWVEGAPGDTLSVTYRLHESYTETLREVKDGPGFEEEITAYADFPLSVLLRSARDFAVASTGLLDALRETYGSGPGADVAAALAVMEGQEEGREPPPVSLPPSRTALEDLGGRLPGYADELRALDHLLRMDKPSALNKIRYVTEKALYELCSAKKVNWGQGEASLERMIGPLVCAGFIPKHIAIHVRTIQTNASPGSHYQAVALGDAHVEIARSALVELLAWLATGP